ncbi:MAG TPA: PCRF domain-containing protein, partial [Candidatus Wallbacteria bacterium]|nr:PCRF domain-containing protein [Candidatus Wallbacteria bacterium]
MFELYSKLEDVEKKFIDLEKQLSDPETIKNQSEFMKLAKNRASMEEAVIGFRKYKETMRELTDNKKMVETEKDPDMLSMVQDEIVRLETEKIDLETHLKFLLIPKDPNDEKNTIVEIRAGAGGEEASLFAGDLFRMYCRYAETKGWKSEVIDSHGSEKGGFKEVV